MNDLKVCWWPIDKPIAYSRNSRKIPERAIDKVAASIKEFGWRQAIVVDKNGVIVCGHTRLLAARKLGLKQVPVHVADNLTPAQVKAYRLMDNRSHEETEWDLELTGFDPHEIEDFLADPNLLDRAEVVPPVPAQPVSKPGDLWLCGNHRILCGDATSSDAVARLCGKAAPFLLVSDPPYGISLDTEWRDRAGLNGKGAAEPSYIGAPKGIVIPASPRIQELIGGRLSRFCLASKLPMFGTPACSPAKCWMDSCGSASCIRNKSSGIRAERS